MLIQLVTNTSIVDYRNITINIPVLEINFIDTTEKKEKIFIKKNINSSNFIMDLKTNIVLKSQQINAQFSF